MADVCPNCGLPKELCVCNILDRETESKIKVYTKKIRLAGRDHLRALSRNGPHASQSVLTSKRVTGPASSPAALPAQHRCGSEAPPAAPARCAPGSSRTGQRRPGGRAERHAVTQGKNGQDTAQPRPRVGVRGAQRLAEIAPHRLGARQPEAAPLGGESVDDLQAPAAFGQALGAAYPRRKSGRRRRRRRSAPRPTTGSNP